jgi:hypothetical protein
MPNTAPPLIGFCRPIDNCQLENEWLWVALSDAVDMADTTTAL